MGYHDGDYKGKCGRCSYYEIACKGEDDVYVYRNNRYYCSEYGTYYHPDETCSRYKDIKGNSTSGGCYITTVVCDILGYTDKCYTLSMLRNFRNNVMQKKPDKYFDTLLEYDAVGPIIAEKIKEEYETTQDKDTWVRFYELYISKTANLVACNDEDAAVSKYRSMVNILKQYFNMEDVDLDSYKENYNPKVGGHGKLMKMSLTTAI